MSIVTPVGFLSGTFVGKLENEGAGKEAVKNIRIPETYKDWWLGEYFWDNAEFVYDTMK